MENVKTAKQSKPIKKIPKIRFQDGPKTLGQGTKVKRQVRKNREEEKKEKKYEKKDEKEEQGEKKPNRFMDEWLGFKREPVDERYKPGKPKPNRLVASPLHGYSDSVSIFLLLLVVSNNFTCFQINAQNVEIIKALDLLKWEPTGLFKTFHSN